MERDYDSQRESAVCQHHWLVEMPNGPTSNARCTRCKMTRIFYNDPDAAMIGAGTPAPQLEPVSPQD
jgi:hypothetical protein